ncbi:hypothetical protein CFE70_007238 [Pyrenophora teres f. teres 0-1]
MIGFIKRLLMGCFSSKYFSFGSGPNFVAMAPNDTSSASGPAVTAWVVKTKFRNTLLANTQIHIVYASRRVNGAQPPDTPGLRCCKFGDMQNFPGHAQQAELRCRRSRLSMSANASKPPLSADGGMSQPVSRQAAAVLARNSNKVSIL